MSTTGTTGATGPRPRARRRRWPALLAVAFVVLPLVEIYAIVQVGQAIGPWWTILLLIADSILGAWLIKREGRRAWRALRTRLDGGGLPTRELADGALILIGGTLLLTPGFVSDVLGFAFVLPFTRPIFRRLLIAYAGSRVGVVATRAGTRPGTRQRPGPDVVRGEVVDDD